MVFIIPAYCGMRLACRKNQTLHWVWEKYTNFPNLFQYETCVRQVCNCWLVLSTNRQTDRQTGRQTHRHTDSSTTYAQFANSSIGSANCSRLVNLIMKYTWTQSTYQRIKNIAFRSEQSFKYVAIWGPTLGHQTWKWWRRHAADHCHSLWNYPCEWPISLALIWFDISLSFDLTYCMSSGKGIG